MASKTRSQGRHALVERTRPPLCDFQAVIRFCGASNVKALRYRATQHIRKVTHRHPVFRVMIRARIKRDHVFRPNEITWQDRRISRDDPRPRGPNATKATALPPLQMRSQFLATPTGFSRDCPPRRPNATTFFKTLRYRATQHIHKVTLPVFSRDVRTQPNATFFFAQTKSRGKTAAFRVMILDHEDQTRPGATALARA